MNANSMINYSMDQIAESPYVLGCRKQNQYKVIDAELPVDWEIPNRLFPADSTIFVNEGNSEALFIFFSETHQFSDIFRIINEIVVHNKEKEEKLVILNDLQVKLQTYFDQLPLHDFKRIVIGMNPEEEQDTKEKIAKNAQVILKETVKPKKESNGESIKP